MTCREFADFIIDYVSGELPPDVLAAFERHLARCENCLTYLDGYTDTVKLGRRAFDDEDAAVPPDVPAALVLAILAARRASQS